MAGIASNRTQATSPTGRSTVDAIHIEHVFSPECPSFVTDVCQSSNELASIAALWRFEALAASSV